MFILYIFIVYYLLLAPTNAHMCRGADKSLARPGRKQATAKDDFEFHVYYL
jgi:hypothetical protein